MKEKERHHVDQSNSDPDHLNHTPAPMHSPPAADRPRAWGSHLWCIPDTKLTTIGKLIIVWGGTAIILGSFFLMMLHTPCESGMGKGECPGWSDLNGAFVPGHRQEQAKGHIGPQDAALPHREIKIRAKPTSTTIDLPASVFITFTPSENTTGPKATTTSTDDTSSPPDETNQPPVTSSPTPTVSEDSPRITITGGVGGSDGDGFDGTTTVVELTTIHAPGTGVTAGPAQTTKASGGSVLRVRSILGAILAVLVGAYSSCSWA